MGKASLARGRELCPGSPLRCRRRLLYGCTMAKTPGVVRVAALADIHLGRVGYGPPLQTLLAQVAESADILALCGDLTDRGEPDEARQLARALASVGVPIVGVLGNHDYECGQPEEVARILH